MSASVTEFKPNTGAPSFNPSGSSFTPKSFNPTAAPAFQPSGMMGNAPQMG